MAALEATFALPLRSFELAVELPIDGTVALVGPSGAGKTSILRALAGLVRPASGRIALGEEVWFDAGSRLFRRPDERRVGLVFQEYALFPHMTVRQNVAYAGAARVDEFLERFRIADLSGAHPAELSGGERQRVALARALARDPGVLLLDEPLSALDAHTKMVVRAELQELLRELGLPTVLVTHDYEDAAALADRVGVIVDGKLRQLDSPEALVARPADVFVASFTGANLLHGVARAGRGDLTEVVLESGDVVFSTEQAEGPVGVVVYPWEVALARSLSEGSAQNVISGEIRSIVLLGNRARVSIGGLTAELTAASVERLGLEVGTPAVASFKATGTRLVALSQS
jgi:ABC-type sulfate/molybdate transport systems ATPase subunit